MADLRLTGAQVRTVRALMNLPGFGALLWSMTARDFRIPELRKLPSSQRAPLDPAPIPLRARVQRGWASAELPAPAVREGSGAALRARFRDGLTVTEQVERVLSEHSSAGSRSPFIALDPERAMAAASASDARWKTGEPLSPVDGLIIPVKDEFDMTGLPTRGGTSWANQPATADAWVIKQLSRAGAIVLGKTHATEFGLNPCGVVEHHIVPRNAYSNEHGAGGSSTGSGVAVALGWCPSAVGTDGGGSIRIPASLNGVFGIKPTYLRIGTTGDRWDANTVAHIGPIGQSTADLVDQLAATAGIDPDAAITRWAPDNHDANPWRAALGRGVKGARIGVLRNELKDADPAIAQLVVDALKALEADGAVLVDVDIPLAAFVNGIGALAIGGETSANVADLYREHGPDFGHELAILLGLMQQVSAQDFLMAQRHRAALRRQTAAALAGVDVLALPSTATTAPLYKSSEDRTAVLDTNATAAMTRFSFLGNLTGLPAGTVPIGLSAGLPVGLQFIGDAWDEASVFAMMAQAERAGLTELPRPKSWLGA